MQLTEEQAYLAMHNFLAKQFSLGWTDLGALLGSMSMLPDGLPADRAFVADWRTAVGAATTGSADARLVLDQ